MNVSDWTLDMQLTKRTYYSQSISTPWKPYFVKKDFSDVMNLARRAGVRARLLKVVLVGPGSLKSQPPIAIHVCSVEDFSPVNSLYRSGSAELAGNTSNVLGSIVANAKFRCVRPLVLISLGEMRLHCLSRTFPPSSICQLCLVAHGVFVKTYGSIQYFAQQT